MLGIFWVLFVRRLHGPCCNVAHGGKKHESFGARRFFESSLPTEYVQHAQILSYVFLWAERGRCCRIANFKKTNSYCFCARVLKSGGKNMQIQHAQICLHLFRLDSVNCTHHNRTTCKKKMTKIVARGSFYPGAKRCKFITHE